MATILVVDDEELILNIIESYLKKQHKIITFHNPEEVISYLDNNSADMLICDFYMPEMTGLDLTKELRKKQNNMPVILMSGSHVNNEDTTLFSSTIKKPFRPKEIQDLVMNVLNK